jgi:rSAM/selenodomain-associated transferase 1
MNSNLLIVFIKNPVEGEVKTRLGASIGSKNALQIYKKLLEHTRDVAVELAPEIDIQVWYSSIIDRRDLWEGHGFEKFLQRGNDLGARMAGAISGGFKAGYERVVIIGSDCPDVIPKHIQSAFSDLKTHDAVIGPATDGGYYLLGLNEFQEDLFRKKEWSESSVFDQTMAVFKDRDLSVCRLEELNDIDTIEDLKRSNLSLP